MFQLSLSKSDRQEIGWDRERWTGYWLQSILWKCSEREILPNGIILEGMTGDDWDFCKREISFLLPSSVVREIADQFILNGNKFPNLSDTLVKKLLKLFVELVRSETDKLSN